MQITTNHPSSSYGVPVILDDRGEPMDYAAGVKAVKARLGMTWAQLAEVCGVSRRTAEMWGQGQVVSAAALNVMADLVNAERSDRPIKDGSEA
jgi:DNA-binding XRE family transcriptional regulator